jgi:hypothetical protein
LLAAPGAYPPLIAVVPNVNEIRQIELSYMCTDGVAANGTQTRNAIISSRMILRNKPPFGQ